MSDTHGERLHRLRIALGHNRRPEFAEIMGMQASRLKNIERGSQKMNQEDFQRIAELWPWALEYIAKGGELVIPEDLDCPANDFAKSIGALNDAAMTCNIANPEDFANAIANNPEAQKAMEKIVRTMMVQALAGKEEDDE